MQLRSLQCRLGTGMQSLTADTSNLVLSFLIPAKMQWVSPGARVTGAGLPDYCALLYHEEAWWSRVARLGFGVVRHPSWEGCRCKEIIHPDLKVPSKFWEVLVPEMFARLLEEHRWTVLHDRFVSPSTDLQHNLLEDLLEMPSEDFKRIHRCPCGWQRLAMNPFRVPYNEMLSGSFCCSFFFDRRSIADFVSGCGLICCDGIECPTMNSTAIQVPGCRWLSMHLSLSASPEGFFEKRACAKDILEDMPPWVKLDVELVMDTAKAPANLLNNPVLAVDNTFLGSGQKASLRFHGFRDDGDHDEHVPLNTTCASCDICAKPELQACQCEDDLDAVVHCAVHVWTIYLGSRCVWPWRDDSVTRLPAPPAVPSLCSEPTS